MDVMDQMDLQAKMAKVGQLNAAMERSRESLRTEPSWQTALELQRLKNQRSGIMATMPPLRLVKSEWSKDVRCSH